MKVRTHLWTSIAAGGGLWWATGSSMALVGAVIDGDHLLDHFWSIRYGAPYARAKPAGAAPADAANSPPVQSSSDWWRRRKLVRLPLIFHSYELLVAALILAGIARTPLVVGIAA